jgi:hypothetical protein
MATAAKDNSTYRSIGLTRIRPNNCAFKDVFFGSNPVEFVSGGASIDVHVRDFKECGNPAQSSAIFVLNLCRILDFNGL